MSRRRTPARRGAHGLHPLRQALPRCLLALLMALPGAAYPITLPQLLRLPLEELLRLEISSSARATRTGALPVAASSSARSVP